MVESLTPSKSPAPTAPPARSSFSRAIDLLLWAAVAAVLFFALMPKDSGPEVGKAAPEELLTVVGGAQSGEERSLPGRLERPLLIEAFASWCGACRRESGLLADLKDAQDRGLLDIIAVSVDDDPQKALAVKKSWPIPVEVLHDPTGHFSRSYHVEVLPTYILIGVDGQIARVTAGTAGASDIRAWLRAGKD